jgi:hypothetical protein
MDDSIEEFLDPYNDEFSGEDEVRVNFEKGI